MALKKVFTDEKGQSAEYFRIMIVAPNFNDDTISINLGAYTDATYRDAEKADGSNMSLYSKAVKLDIVSEDFSRETLYARIKAEDEEFSDAIDC